MQYLIYSIVQIAIAKSPVILTNPFIQAFVLLQKGFLWLKLGMEMASVSNVF